MAASRKPQPDPLESLLSHWPDELSGQCAFEVGLSGGLDSVALLALLCRARARRPELEIRAVHVHHGLSPNADAWAEHCRVLCATLDAPLRVERVSVVLSGGDSLEAVAREARYQAYRRSAAGVVVLAHHLDDQAETVLLQLLRGGGARALAAMPALRKLEAEGPWLWRPLLGLRRRQLEDFVRAQGLSWVEDESNLDERWRRNFLRQRLLPQLEAAVPDYRRHLTRSAGLLSDAAAVLDEVAAQDLAVCRNDGGLDLIRWRALSAARQRQTLLAWLRGLGWPAPEPDALAEFQRQALEAGAGSCPRLSLARGLLYRYRDGLFALSALPAPGAVALGPVDPATERVSAEWGGALSWDWRPRGLSADTLARGLILRPREGGERLASGVGRKPVKSFLQEAGIAPPLRERWPLLCDADGRVLALPGVAVDSEQASEPGWWPQWRPLPTAPR
ncbi:tRNA lysidine(34) synthetase TilS [Chromobacterium rhizoryzae]|uniref:tRNA(Ile)-lysidine synthase n=1 Tax=Chromobacterium rhizoryzae TaxID=1778675 RepID=A0AAD0RRU0_9NEIS|nr:tRNA lysidine(34) synthetase TilS [Chromobacterium rhizoryzae]